VDGHVWVADAVQDILQCYTAEGRFLMWMGGHGLFPGQFRALAGLSIDKNNRIFTSEQYPGRVQMFRYFTDDEARTQIKQRQAEMEQKKSQGAAKTGAAENAPPASPENSAAEKPQ